MRLDNAKILISDDSILARKQLKDFISKYGTPTFFEASNGQDAIDIYKKEKPDLSFLEMAMQQSVKLLILTKMQKSLSFLLSEHSHSCVPPLKPVQRILSRNL